MLKRIKKKIKPIKLVLSKWLWKQVVFARYRKNEKELVKKIKSGEKGKIVFLVREVAKWNATTVFKEMKASAYFEPIVAISIIRDQFHTVDDRCEEIAKSVQFFESIGIDYKVIYDPNQDVESCMSKLNPGLIFYDQPWSLKSVHNLKLTSKFALSAYIPYSMEIANTAEASFNTEFQNLLWLYLAPNQFVEKNFSRALLSRPMFSFVSGYPKLDAYLFKPSEIKKQKIIYAPHHSLEIDSGLQYATFSWSGRLMLELVKKHPNIEWVFKPHPRLRSALVTNCVMTQEEVDEYYGEWRTLLNSSLCDGGDYLEVFKSSGVMITDCVSFLAEYLPTKNPILHMINPNSIGFNDLGRLIIKDYYKSESRQDFMAQFERVVVKGDDYLKSKRLEALEHVYIAEKGAGKAIVEYLNSKLGRVV